ncbi:MAG: tRNA 5-methylaminomethyl-2-thiouridine biosynthesis bifunctional protein, partial [bacterium]
MSFEYAKVSWQEEQPYSKEFGDVYFSKDEGLEEKNYVFLVQNFLEQRWKQLNTQQFLIAETGFGIGLNFLATWFLWKQIAPPESKLRFVSFEKFPLSKEHIEQALLLWPSLKKERETFLNHYEDLLDQGE